MTAARPLHRGIRAAALLALLSPAAGLAQSHARVAENGPPLVILPGMPTRGQVLRDIYLGENARNPRGGPVSFDLGDGREGVWWYGYKFEFEGEHYFTGFAYLKQDTDAPGEERARAAQATYWMDSHGDSYGWGLIDSDAHIGHFLLGPDERIPEIERGERAILRHETGDGRLLIGLPIRRSTDGIEQLEYELFLFDPRPEAYSHGRLWAALGSVFSGANNADDCGEERGRTCWPTTGTIHFTGSTNGLPAVKVTLSGSRAEGPENIRKLGPGDFLTYSFSPKERAYTIMQSTIAAN